MSPLTCFSVIFLVLFCNVFASPVIIKDDIDDGDDGDDVLDIAYLKSRIIRMPSNKTGIRVANWNPSMKVNPEELGDYFEGDILHPLVVKKSGLKGWKSKWRRRVVPYVITGQFTAAERALIMSAIDDYHTLTCIKFVVRTNEEDYVNIGSENTGCWSSIGKTGGEQLLNLQSPGCVTLKGTILHELMHALGFIHEHARPERDRFVQIMVQNIEEGNEDNFELFPGNLVKAFGVRYDYGSVMHYSSHAFSSNGQPTIVPLRPGVQIGQRVALSDSDVRSIRAMYRCD